MHTVVRRGWACSGVMALGLSLGVGAARLPAQSLTQPLPPEVLAADSAALARGDYAALLPVSGQFRVCADPNALPYSNTAQEGFENKLAEMIAREFKAGVTYTWYPQRRGFVRNTLQDNQCDVVMGIPSTVDMVLTSIPYYRSTYVFIYRTDRGLDIRSFDDPALKKLKIGVYQFGNDYVNTPPVHALLQRGVPPDNFVGYSLYGDYAKPNPPADLIDAVARGEVDLAVGWGPIAGYFARHEPVGLRIVPVSPSIDLPFRPYVYDMSIGVRREDKPLKEAIDQILTRHRAEIRQLLQAYGIPLVERQGAAQTTAELTKK